MDTLDAIIQRRSIRKFSDAEIPREDIERILNAALAAPSAKNRQPWKFIVVTNRGKDDMIRAMMEGIENEKTGNGLFPGAARYLAGAENTLEVMKLSPVTVFVFNTEKNHLWDDADISGKLFDIANIQSIGAAIENMLLAATDLGIGSLWICDVFFAYRELCQWLREDNQMIAAVSFGYADESPGSRPRRAMKSIVEWR